MVYFYREAATGLPTPLSRRSNWRPFTAGYLKNITNPITFRSVHFDGLLLGLLLDHFIVVKSIHAACNMLWRLRGAIPTPHGHSHSRLWAKAPYFADRATLVAQ